MARRRRSRSKQADEKAEEKAETAPADGTADATEQGGDPAQPDTAQTEPATAPTPDADPAAAATPDAEPDVPPALEFDKAASDRILTACAGIHSFAHNASDEASRAAAPFLSFAQRARIRALATDFGARRQTFNVQAGPAPTQAPAQVVEGPSLGREEVEAIVNHRIEIAVQEGRFLQITSLLPLEAALKEGRGVVLVTPTYGAWEQIAPAVARRGYRVGLLDLRPADRRPPHRFPAAPGLDLRLLNADGYARPLVRFVSEPNVLVVLGDGNAGPRLAHSSLFGRPVEVSSTPFELARRVGLAVLPVFAVRQNDGHRLVVEKALRISDTGRGDGDLDVTAGRWLKLVERWARRHPDHYLGHLLVHRLRGGGAFFSDAA